MTNIKTELAQNLYNELPALLKEKLNKSDRLLIEEMVAIRAYDIGWGMAKQIYKSLSKRKTTN